MNSAARAYLDVLCARDYPEQEPAHAVAKNADLLWFLVPVCGLVLFVSAIEARYAKAREGVW